MQTRYAASTRTPNRQNRKLPPGAVTQLRLIACLFLLAAVVLLRAFFPGATAAVRANLLPQVQGGMDYRGSIAAIGETLTGERGILDVLGEIGVYALGNHPRDSVAVHGETLSYVPPPPPIEDVIPIPTSAAEAFLQIPVAPLSERRLAASLNSERVREVRAAFSAHQAEFAEYDPPLNVGFDYIPIDITPIAVPVRGAVASPFGFRVSPTRGEVAFHFGVDIAASIGTPLHAFAAGYVRATGENAIIGKYIVLYHGDGITTRYIHCNHIYVEPGQQIAAGQRIGQTGATGRVTGPHLHFELSIDGIYVNPEFYLHFDS